MEVRKSAVEDDSLAYLLVADKALRYGNGMSRIVYVGMTGKGHKRISTSVSERARDILDKRGVQAFEVHRLACDAAPLGNAPLALERCLLYQFVARYGSRPSLNGNGGIKLETAFAFFRRERINQIILWYEDLAPPKATAAW